MCFSDHQPGSSGRQPGSFRPRWVRQDELRAAFGDGWTVTRIAADTFDLNSRFGTRTAQAWLATIRRL
jgi:hypothetical protein